MSVSTRSAARTSFWSLSPPSSLSHISLTHVHARTHAHTESSHLAFPPFPDSVGIAPNRMLAKICSDKNKPNGQVRACTQRGSGCRLINLHARSGVAWTGHDPGQHPRLNRMSCRSLLNPGQDHGATCARGCRRALRWAALDLPALAPLPCPAVRTGSQLASGSGVCTGTGHSKSSRHRKGSSVCQACTAVQAASSLARSRNVDARRLSLRLAADVALGTVCRGAPARHSATRPLG